MRPDLSTYLVADPEVCGDRGVVDTAVAAVRGGATVVQLRDKHASAHALYRTATALLQGLRGTGVPVVVNDRLDIALAAGADGVHLGQDDLPAQEARRLAGPGFLVGLSVSTLEELTRADALPDGTVDYLGVGPVFVTPTKTDAQDAVGLEGLADLCRRTDLPCAAIGGIHAGNAAEVRSTGVDGIAMVSAICAAPDPAEAAAGLGAVLR